MSLADWIILVSTVVLICALELKYLEKNHEQK